MPSTKTKTWFNKTKMFSPTDTSFYSTIKSLDSYSLSLREDLEVPRKEICLTWLSGPSRCKPRI